jgi:hypothetical protein
MLFIYLCIYFYCIGLRVLGTKHLGFCVRICGLRLVVATRRWPIDGVASNLWVIHIISCRIAEVFVCWMNFIILPIPTQTDNESAKRQAAWGVRARVGHPDGSAGKHMKLIQKCYADSS